MSDVEASASLVLQDAPIVLETIGVKKSYKMGNVTVEALRGVDIEIRRGDFIAITGPSGSGKSTLLNIIGCLDRSTDGVVKIDGVSVSNTSERQLTEIRRHKIGFVFQKFYLMPFLTALQNVEFQARLSGIENRWAKSIEALELVGLSKRVDHLPKEMSGGEQQRVAIARALVKAPSIILADEPTGNLDTKTGNQVMDTFKKLNSQGITTVIVTHNQEIADMACRTITMRDGLLEE